MNVDIAGRLYPHNSVNCKYLVNLTPNCIATNSNFDILSHCQFSFQFIIFKFFPVTLCIIVQYLIIFSLLVF